MKTVTAFVGSARKQHTYHAVEQFLARLEGRGDVRGDIVRMSEVRLKTCCGCKLCFDQGSGFCPLDDDRDLLIEKMMASDGVVFATPNYTFQVSGYMKVFLDRLGFVCHRPRFFGKAFTSIVVQGIYGGTKIVKYLDFVGNGLGFNTLKGCVVNSLEPMSEEAQQKFDRAIAKHADRFYARLGKPAYPAPSLMKLMMFRMSRTSMQRMLNEDYRDYTYYAEQGWFESDYYYPTQLGPVKKLVGRLFDAVGAMMAG